MPCSARSWASSRSATRPAIGHQLAAAAERIAGAELPAALVHEVETRAAGLGVLAVRSSATIEDGEAGAAAGVFSSRRAVPAADVWAAIRAVWTSALTPLAAAYARRRGGSIAIGVIVQAFVPGARVTVYTRMPGRPASDEACDPARQPRSPWSPRDVGRPGAGARDACGGRDRRAGRRRCRARRRARVVQARPIVHPAREPRAPVPPAILAALVADGRRWTWDVAHNPDPLSPAQAGLVERIDRDESSPYALRVCAGYLYTTVRDAPPAVAAATTRDELVARADVLERRLAEALGIPGVTHPLDPRRPAPAPASDRRARADDTADGRGRDRALPRVRSDPDVGARPAGRRDARDADGCAARGRAPIRRRGDAARGRARRARRGDGDRAARRCWRRRGTSRCRPTASGPASCATRSRARERSPRVGFATRRRRAPAPTSRPPPAPTSRRAAADLAERDDLWFARAQLAGPPRGARARRAARPRSRRWVLAPARRARAPAASIPTTFAGGPRRRAAPPSEPPGGRCRSDRRWRSGGAGARAPRRRYRPRITGRVVRYATLGSAIAASTGDVVVARAVTPALAVQVDRLRRAGQRDRWVTRSRCGARPRARHPVRGRLPRCVVAA